MTHIDKERLSYILRFSSTMQTREKTLRIATEIKDKLEYIYAKDSYYLLVFVMIS